MPDSVQGAYLVLLGQIVLAASAIFFGVPYCFATDTALAIPKSSTALYLAFVFVACSMMIANILIGWASSRQIIDRKCAYSNKMFVWDLLSIVCFFAMNNIIMLSFGGTFTIDGAPAVKKVLQQGISVGTTAVTSSGLYFLTAAFLLTCKFWNREYYKTIPREDAAADNIYERSMWAVIYYCLLASVVAIIYRENIWIQAYLLVFWIASWIGVNGHWIFRNFKIYEPRSQSDNIVNTGFIGPTAPLAQAEPSPVTPERYIIKPSPILIGSTSTLPKKTRAERRRNKRK